MKIKQHFIAMVLIMALFPLFTYSQIITGTVQDADTEEPLIAANVIVKGTSIGTVTDLDGRFKLEIDTSCKVLLIAYTGYEQQEIPIGTDKEFSIALKPSAVVLESVVVTGLAVTRVEHASAYSVSSTTSGVSIKGSRGKAPAIATPGVHGGEEGISPGTLTAGEINDFSKWTLWNDRSSKELKEHRKSWRFNPQQRFSVLVENEEGLPVVGQKVRLLDRAGKLIWEAVTDNVGRAELWGQMFDKPKNNSSRFRIETAHEGEDYAINRAKPFKNGPNYLTIPKTCDPPNIVEAVFVVDATGSMADEIRYLQQELNDVIQRVQSDNQDIRLRMGSVFYRDTGDEYVTRKADITSDIGRLTGFINEQSSGGGGDFPEAVDKGLEVAIDTLQWSENARTKVIFLVLDAPPHGKTEIQQEMERLSKKAAAMGIKIVPITGSGIDKATEYLMRCLALSTNGTYVFLTNHSGVGNDHIEPTTDTYKVEKLNDLMVRLFDQFISVVSCEGTFPEKEEAVAVDSTETTVPAAATNTTEVLHCTVYPNPTSGICQVELNRKVQETYILDLSGKILEKIPSGSRTKFQVNISKYPSGVYFLSFLDEQRTSVAERIVLVR